MKKRNKKIILLSLIFPQILAFVLVSCGATRSNLNGKYVNTKNVFNDYYIFDKKKSEYLHYQNGNNTKGSFIQEKSLVYIESDSIYYYDNQNLHVEIKESKSFDLSFISLKKDTYDNFTKKFPAIKLFFVAYPSAIDKNKSPIIVPINSNEHSFSTADYEVFPQYFRIIGLNYDCGVLYDPESCDVFEKSFQTKLYKLENYSGAVNVTIDMSNLISKNLNTIKRIESIDSVFSAKRFKNNGKFYEKL